MTSSLTEPSLRWLANGASHFNNIGRLDDHTAISDMRLRLRHVDDESRFECRITHPRIPGEKSKKLSCAFRLQVKVSFTRNIIFGGGGSKYQEYAVNIIWVLDLEV